MVVCGVEWLFVTWGGCLWRGVVFCGIEWLFVAWGGRLCTGVVLLVV